MKNLILSLSCVMCFCGAALSQNTHVTWSAFGSGSALLVDANTQVQAVTGQTFVGALQGSTISAGSGFLSNPAISGPPPHTGIFTVTTTNDSGPGSLRRAIDSANTTEGVNIITFNIPGSGVHTILPTTPLPAFTDPVIIDGYTQPGASENTNPIGMANNAALRIQLTGPGAFTGTTALVLRGGNSTVRGLVINAFGTAISIENTGGVTIEGNFIGTDSTGTLNRGNQTGVRILASGNTVGGASPASFNVISGNSLYGVRITGNSATSNLVLGNYLGTTSSGNGDLTNGCGVWLEAPGNFIGGGDIGTRNIILGGLNPAIYLAEGYAGGNTIRYNFIGTNASGTAGLGFAGVYIYTPNNAVMNNVISGGRGVQIGEAAAAGNVIQGNYIGLSADGAATLTNNGGGINLTRVSHTLIGGLAPETRNVIAVLGNAINIANGDSNTVQGNYIGTNAAGTVGLIPNGSAGPGVLLSATTRNLIGGTEPGARNVIANTHTGISITAGSWENRIQGNFIGTNALGTAAIPNRTRGIVVVTPQGSNLTRDNLIGGVEPGAGNLISGNFGPGILISGTNANTIQSNLIGLASDGTSPLPNSRDGIELSYSDSNLVGGAQPGAGNRIAFNGVGFTDSRANGIKMWNGTANAIISNSIFSNQRLGIDLVGGTENLLGVTANDSCDSDTGPNDLQNYPILTSAIPAQGELRVLGTMNSDPYTTLLLQFFSAPAPDTSGHGGGRDFLGSFYITTGSNCTASFDTTLPVSVPLGHHVTSTATDAAGNTSEFSLSIPNGTTSVQQQGDGVPTTFALEQNYPNPFNPSTTIGFQVPEQSHVTIKVFDVMGQEVTTLVDETKAIGRYAVVWNAGNVASGVYFYRITAGRFVDVKKLLLLR